MGKEKEVGNEIFGVTGINPKRCRTCAMASGPAPFADGPEKSYCLVYSREAGLRKPPKVYYDGGECDYHVAE